MNRFLPLWPHRFPHFGYINLGAWGGSDIRSMSSIRPICKCRCPPLVIRTGGTAGSPHPPPSCYIPTPLFSIQRPQRWISVTAFICRLWVCRLILDSDGDHFLFSPIFCRTRVSSDKILTAIVWRKLVKSYRAPIFCRRNICDVFCISGRYNKPVQCGRESVHKSRAASGNGTLGNCTWRDQHLLGEVGEHQQCLGEVSCCGLC